MTDKRTPGTASLHNTRGKNICHEDCFKSRSEDCFCRRNGPVDLPTDVEKQEEDLLFRWSVYALCFSTTPRAQSVTA